MSGICSMIVKDISPVFVKGASPHTARPSGEMPQSFDINAAAKQPQARQGCKISQHVHVGHAGHCLLDAASDLIR